MSTITAERLNEQLDSNEWPLIESLVHVENGVELELSVTEDLSYFEGHFPEQAVLPGVIQVHWVGELAGKLFSDQNISIGYFSELKSLKFNSMVLPNTKLNLKLQFNAERNSLTFSYFSENDKYSSGVLGFSPTKLHS